MSTIRERRQALNLSQLKLAQLAGVSRYNLHIHERGACELKEFEIQKINAVLEQEASRLQKVLADFEAQDEKQR